MRKRLTAFAVVVSCMLLLSGCKQENPENEPEVEAADVQKEMAEAAEAGGAYLNQQKEALMEKAGEAYAQLETDTKQLIADLKVSGKEAWQQTSSQLDGKLNAAKQKFSELKEASGENLDKAKNAFDAATAELKDAYEKAKAELQKDNG